MTREEAAKWLNAIKDKYIRGGDEDFDNKRREAIDTAIRSLEAIPELGKKLRMVRGGIKDKNVLLGYNVAVAICNKYLGEEGCQEKKQQN